MKPVQSWREAIDMSLFAVAVGGTFVVVNWYFILTRCFGVKF